MPLDDFAPRKTHRKSRTGCGTCKQRRVKCDESKPRCRNCARRELPCNYDDRPTSLLQSPSHIGITTGDTNLLTPSAESAVHLALNTPPATILDRSPIPSYSDTHGATTFDTLDLELLHHFSMRASLTLAGEPHGLDFWRAGIPTIAFQHPFVLHAMLALSAMYLAHCHPERKAECHAKSDFHHSIALPKMIEALSHPNEANAEPLFIGAMILCFHSLAKGPQKGEYLAFSDHGETEWMRLFRGVQSIVSQLQVLPLDIFRRGATNTTAPGSNDAVEVIRQPIIAFQEPLARLRTFLDAVTAENPSARKYTAAVDDLEGCFTRGFEAEDPKHPEARVPSHLIFSWLYRLEEGFLVALQERRPLALVIFAHYLVLLAQLREKWYLQGWVPHIMNGIYGHLHAEYRPWLRWPGEMIVWEPG